VCGGVGSLPLCCGGVIFGGFVVVVFVFWGCFVVFFGLVLVLFCHCMAAGLLECGLSGVGASFYVLVSLLGSFSCVFGWCSRLFGGLGPQTGVRISPGLCVNNLKANPSSFSPSLSISCARRQIVIKYTYDTSIWRSGCQSLKPHDSVRRRN